jgi:hypothetical protein
MQKKRRPMLADESAALGTDKLIVPYEVKRIVRAQDGFRSGCCVVATLRGS